MRNRLVIWSGFALIVAPLGCGPVDNPLAPQAHTVGISVDVGARAISAGQSATFRLIVERASGFEGPVTLNIDGVPKGVFAVFSPSTIADSQFVSTLTLVAADSATASRAMIKVSARGIGVKARTATIQLWVSPDSSVTGIKARPTTPGWAPGSDKGG